MKIFCSYDADFEKRKNSCLSNIIEVYHHPAFIIDKQCRILCSNTFLADNLGASERNINGKTLDSVNIFGIEKHCAELLLSGEEELYKQFPETVKKREMYISQCSVNGMELIIETAYLKDCNDDIIGVFQSIEDITAINNARRDLEDAVQRARHLAEQAKAADHAKSNFLANMSHEIRTPLNAIVGMTTLLRDTQMTEEQNDYIETIRNASDSLLGVINDILDFSKIEAGKIEFEEMFFCFDELIDEAIDIISYKAREKNLCLCAVINHDVPQYLSGDPGRIRQVLLNILGNAVKFTQKGRVVLRVAVEDKNSSRAVLRFKVVDTGIGIPAENIGKLFRSFSQLDGSLSRKYGGTGLGLSISKKLVEMMNGSFEVESTPGKGSIFSFNIVVNLQPEQKITESDVRCLVISDRECEADAVIETVKSLSGKADLIMGENFNAVLYNTAVIISEHASDALVLHKIIAEKNREIRLLIVTPYTEHKKNRDIFAQKKIDTLVTPLKRNALKNYFLRNESVVSSTLFVNAYSLRILIAEDNITNQKVCLKLVERLGHTADVVANGKEAVEAVQQINYDLVLMDIQMPEMDGIEATQVIRGLPGEVSKMPIIAVTANAMKGDMERYLASGMDGYVPKPIEIHVLQSEIVKIMGGILPDKAKSQNVFDVQRLKDAMDGDEDIIKEIVEVFLLDTPVQIQKLKHAVQENDIELVRRQAHTIKGSAGTIGGAGLKDAAYQIELLGKSGDISEAGKLCRILEKEFSDLQNELKKHYS